MSAESPERYNSVAIILHWVMAIAIFGMLASGFAMEYLGLDRSIKFQMIQIHKSAGVLLLIAIFLRFSWRMATKIPALPGMMPKLEKLAAKGGHLALYICMFLMPISGWVMVSSSSYGLPTVVFDWFTWPHVHEVFSVFSFVEGNEDLRKLYGSVHFYVALAFIVLILAHIGAVVKHYIFDHENLLHRMWWTRKGYEEE